MKKHQIVILIKVLLGITSLVSVIGAFLEITHNENELLIFMIGIVPFVLVITYNQFRLSKYKYLYIRK